MSRIGKKPIKILEGMKVNMSNNLLRIESNSNQLEIRLPEEISVEISSDKVILKPKDDSLASKSLHGLMARLIGNAIYDLKNGVSIKLNFKGSGYRARVENNQLILNMGYSHEIKLEIPKGINVSVAKNVISVEGFSRQQVSELAAKIRRVRPPEVYKGKGIKYFDEEIRKKAGKAAQTVGKGV